MERLLHSPGRTRDEHRYQTARPSSQLISRTVTFGSTTPLRGNEIASEFVAKPTDRLDYSNKFTGRKINEKELLQGLNDRFAGFIEKVHHLENQNRALEREIEIITLKTKSSASLSKYESELKDLRRQVHEICLQKHKIEVNRQNLADEFNILKEKYDSETRGRVDAEGNISVLKKYINDAYLAKQEMDRKAKSLEDEIGFLKNNHEREVAEMMAQIQEGHVTAEKRDYGRSDITAALRDIRMQLEGHTASDTRYAEERFCAQLAKLTKAAEVNREALMATKAEINEHRRQLQSKNIELDSVKGVREALEKQLYDLEQRHNAEIHHYQDTIRELEFELKNAKYDISGHVREYQDLLNVKMALDAEIYSYRKLLEGEESRYSTISDAHISVPYIYRQSPIYTLPCVKRQGGGRKAEPQYKFVEEIITETTREDVEISDTGSDKSGEDEGDKPEETNAEKDTEGDISQEAKDEEPQPAMENVDAESSKLEEENEVKAEENYVKPTEESDNKEDKPAENTMSVSEVEQDKDAESEPTQDEIPTKNVTDDKGKDEEIDTKSLQNEDLKDDMKGKAKIAPSDVPVEDVKKTDEPAKEAEKDDVKKKDEPAKEAEKDDVKKTDEPAKEAEKDDVKKTDKPAKEAEKDDVKKTDKPAKEAEKDDVKKTDKPAKGAEKDDVKKTDKPAKEAEKDDVKKTDKPAKEAEKDDVKKTDEPAKEAEKDDVKKTDKPAKEAKKDDVKKKDEPAKEAEKDDVKKSDLREQKVIPEKSDETEPEDKTSQEPCDPETTDHVNHKPSEKAVEVTSQGKDDDGQKDATITSQDSSKSADKEKETSVKEKETPVKETVSVDVDTPTLDLQPAPENAENGQKTPPVEDMKDKSKNASSLKQETSSTINVEAKKSEHMGKVDTSKITDDEKPIEKHQETQSKTKEKEQIPEESTKTEASKADGLMDSVTPVKGENVKSDAPENPQAELSKVAGEKAKPDRSEKQEDSKDSGEDGVKTSEEETKVTDMKVGETQSNKASKADEPKPDAKPVQKETQENKVKMPENTEGTDSVTTSGPQTDSGNTKDVKSEETVPKVNQSDSASLEPKDVKSDTPIKSEMKPLEKTEQVKESSKEDSMNTKDLGEASKPSNAM